MNKREERYQRKLKRDQAAIGNMLTVIGKQSRMTYNEISASAKKSRSKNYGGRVLWDSARQGPFTGSTDRLRRR